jgi:ornithine cyclodeaminase/alanine dehydrogenase-like protein (mu-crystallin family)
MHAVAVHALAHWLHLRDLLAVHGGYTPLHKIHQVPRQRRHSHAMLPCAHAHTMHCAVLPDTKRPSALDHGCCLTNAYTGHAGRVAARHLAHDNDIPHDSADQLGHCHCQHQLLCNNDWRTVLGILHDAGRLARKHAEMLYLYLYQLLHTC